MRQGRYVVVVFDLPNYLWVRLIIPQMLGYPSLEWLPFFYFSYYATLFGNVRVPLGVPLGYMREDETVLANSPTLTEM